MTFMNPSINSNCVVLVMDGTHHLNQDILEQK